MLKINDTFTIHELVSFFTHKKIDTVNSFEKLKTKITGYFYFDIQKSKIKHHLARVNYKDEIYNIIDGIFISPYARSILTNKPERLNGLLLDTTFKVLPYFFTSILLVSIKNTGIPISFSFGSSENKTLYMRHFIFF